MRRRLLSIVCVVALIFSLLPTMAFAAEPDFTLALDVTATVGNTGENRPLNELRTGDIVTAKIVLPANCTLGALQAELKFDNNRFEVATTTEKLEDGTTITYGNTRSYLEEYSSAKKSGWININITEYVEANREGFVVVSATGQKLVGNKTVFGNVTNKEEVKLLEVEFAVKENAPVGNASFSIGKTVFSHEVENKTTNYTVGLPATVSATVVQELSSVALSGSVATPTKGGTYTSNVTGSNVDAQVSWSPALEDGKFAANTEYTATVKVTPKEGYLFAENVAFTGLDGYTFEKQSDGSYQASKKYEKTADKYLTKLEITKAPTKTEYVHGDTFVSDGMVVKATYDDGSVDAAFTGYTVDKSVVKFGDTAVTLKSGVLTATQDITVGKKELTITGLKASDRAFDGTVDVAVTGGELVGVLAGEEVTVEMPTGGKMTDANVGTNKSVSDLSATLAGEDAANYTLAKIDDIRVNITPKSVAAEWTAEESYTYTGAELTAPTAVYTDVNSAKVACEVTCDKPFKDVGEYTFTAATKDANYTLTNSTKTVTVNKAAITGVAVTQTGELTYNGEAQIANVHTTAVTKGGVSVAFTYSAAENGTYAAAVPAFTDAGTYTVYYKADAENHETAAGSFTVTIGKASAPSGITGEVSLYHADTTAGTFEASALKKVPAVGWTDVKFVSATASDSSVISSVSVENGKLSYAPTGAAGAGKTETVTATVSSKNYENATVTLTFKTVDINIDWTAIGKDNIALKSAPVYGDKNSDILTIRNPKYTARTTVDVPGKLSVQEPNSYPAAGTKSVTLVFTPDPSTGISGTFTHQYTISAIAKKSITVTADTKTAIYGEKIPALTFTVPAGALVGNDTVGSLGVTLATSATSTSSVDTYDITGTCTAKNYEVAVNGTGKLTITPAELTIKNVALENRAYNGQKNVTVESVTFAGLQNSEKLTIDTDYTATGAMTDANAGENKDVTVTVTLKDTVKNYTLKNRVYESGKVTIAKASHENVTANMEAKYGNTATLNLATLNLPAGCSFGEISTTDADSIFDGTPSIANSTLSAKLANGAAKAGKKATIKILVSSTNYADYTIEVTVTVAAKDTQTITASNIRATYGDTGVKVNATAVGALNYSVISGDDVIDIDASGNVTIKKAGQAKIKISAAETNDYAAATKEITVTIAKRPLIVKADDKTAYIGDKQPELTYTVSGLVGNDKLTPVPTLKLVHDANVDPMKQAGTYVIGFETEPAASANYELSAQTGTLTVSARPSYVGPTGNAVSVDRTENGKISVSPSYATKGSTVTITVTPNKDQELKSLEVIDQNGNSLPLTDLGNGKFSFVMPAGKVTVKPVFGAADAYRNPYADVQTNDWYFGAVQYVTENGLMNGTGNGFEPNLATSRAMIWTILARMSDVNTASSGEWYAVAQQWAIANGVSDGTMPNGTITREQLAAMLYRYAVSKGMVKGPATADLSVFADANSVSSYAVEAMQWAVSAGLISGMDGKLNPQGSATRAQVATMLMRFAELAK